MGYRISEVLNATGMRLPLFCGGMSKVGFGISGTWTGTIAFSYSTDGINFQPLYVTPYASGTAVASTTATGNWEAAVKGAVAVQVTFTRTSGSAIVVMTASLDSSYQEAFLASSSRFLNHTASGATNTLTIAASTNRAWRIRTLVVSVDTTPTWAASPNVQIKDGTTVLWATDLPATAGQYTIPLPADPNVPGMVGGGVINTPGAAMSVVVASGAGSVNTNIDAEVWPA